MFIGSRVHTRNVWQIKRFHLVLPSLLPSLAAVARRPNQPLNTLPPQPCSNTTFQASVRLSVALRNALQLILLLDRIAVAAPLGRIDELLSQTLGHALDVAERRLPRADGQEGDGLVDAAQRGDVDGLATHGACAADTGAVFARAAVDDGVDGDLDGVLVGHDVDLPNIPY